MAHAAWRRKRIEHKRSKRGCLTCRAMRKKCPEDFQSWPSNAQSHNEVSSPTWACSACHRRGEVCRMPSTSSKVAQHHLSLPQNPNHQSPSAQNQALHAVPVFQGLGRDGAPDTSPRVHSGIVEAADALLNFQERARRPLTTQTASEPSPSDQSANQNAFVDVAAEHSSTRAVPLQEQQLLIAPASVVGSVIQASSGQLAAPASIAPGPRDPFTFVAPLSGVSFEQQIPDASSSRSWLDDVFDAISVLADSSSFDSQNQSMMTPTLSHSHQSHVQQPTWRQRHSPEGSTASLISDSAVSPPAPTGPTTSNTPSTLANRKGSTDWDIDHAIQFQDLDGLLRRCSKIYRVYMRAVVDASDPKGDASTQPLIDHLMDITRSCNVCKASMVAFCFAYRDLIVRESFSTSRPPSDFVRYLTFRGAHLDGSGEAGARNHHPDSKNSCAEEHAPAPSTAVPRSDKQTRSAAGIARAWATHAIQGFRCFQGEMPLTARLLTLLNLRHTCVCMLGAKEAFALAPDIHATVSEERRLSKTKGELFALLTHSTSMIQHNI